MVKYLNASAAEPRRRDPLWVTSRWGRQDVTIVSAAVFGSATARLVVFKPGTAAADRFWAHVYGTLVYREMWWFVAAATVFLSFGVLPREGRLIWMLVVAAAVTGCLVLVSWALGRRALAGARGIKITVRKGYVRGRDLRLEQDSAFGDELCRQLRVLDRARLDPVLYEAKWGEIYDEVGQSPSPLMT